MGGVWDIFSSHVQCFRVSCKIPQRHEVYPELFLVEYSFKTPAKLCSVEGRKSSFHLQDDKPNSKKLGLEASQWTNDAVKSAA